MFSQVTFLTSLLLETILRKKKKLALCVFSNTAQCGRFLYHFNAPTNKTYLAMRRWSHLMMMVVESFRYLV